MSSVVTRLIAKDLYMNRWLLALVAVGGIASLLIAGVSRIAFNIGSVFYLTVIIALGIIVLMYSVVQERKEHSLLFVLSLPLSPGEYLKAKILAMLSVFMLPWTLLTAAGVILIASSRVPDGMIPFFVLVSMLMLMNFCVILGVALITTTEAVVTGTVIATNVLVSLLFVLLANIPSISEATRHDAIAWSAPVFWILAAEGAITLVALALPFIVGRHRRSLI